MSRKNQRIRSTIFDPSRSILVQDTPEERVRQELVQVLIEKMSVPIEAIKTEYPLNHLDSNTLKRADVVVWYREHRYDHDKPLIVFEVKASHIEITDQTLDQVLSYQEVLQCPFVGITNGNHTLLYEVNQQGEVKLLADNIYSYENFIGRNVIYTNNTLRMRRLSYNEIQYSKYTSFLVGEGYIGEDTPQNLHHFMAELQNMLMKEEILSELPISRYGITIKDDISYSYLTYGNAAGGKFTGYYRGFVVEDLDGNEQIYRLAVFGTGSTKDDPVFGNRKGSTVLFVTVDHHVHGSHNALQLNLDRSIVESSEKQSFVILHDGRMTINKGAIKTQDVLDFVGDSNRFLIKCGKIDLGELPSNRSITWDEAEEFVFRVFLYTTLREKLRFKYNPKKNTKKPRAKRQIIKKI